MADRAAPAEQPTRLQRLQLHIDAVEDELTELWRQKRDEQDAVEREKIEAKIEKNKTYHMKLLDEKRSREGAAAGGAPAAGTCCTHPPSCLSFPHLWRTAKRQFAKGTVYVQGWDNLTHALCGDVYVAGHGGPSHRGVLSQVFCTNRLIHRHVHPARFAICRRSKRSSTIRYIVVSLHPLYAPRHHSTVVARSSA